jgi:hypothetical protein
MSGAGRDVDCGPEEQVRRGTSEENSCDKSTETPFEDLNADIRFTVQSWHHNAVHWTR